MKDYVCKRLFGNPWEVMIHMKQETALPPVDFSQQEPFIRQMKEKNDIFAHALLTMLPISAVSFAVYLIRGYVKLEVSLIYLILPAALGGLLGAYLLKKIKFKIVRLLFIGLVIYSGFTMIF